MEEAEQADRVLVMARGNILADGSPRDVFSDIDTIRANAALGATALQEVPTEYITETELANKNYASSSYVIGELAKKSDTGHTHSEYVTETELTSKNFTTVSDVENKINALDATISGNSSHVTVKITEENGKLSSLNVTESNSLNYSAKKPNHVL